MGLVLINATLAKSPFPLPAHVFPSLGNGTLDGWISTFLSALMLVECQVTKQTLPLR